jgi:hypothetical protein
VTQVCSWCLQRLHLLLLLPPHLHLLLHRQLHCSAAAFPVLSAVMQGLPGSVPVHQLCPALHQTSLDQPMAT